MFKAKKKNPKQKRAFRKKEEEEDQAEEEGGASESIARIKKKRKLLTELQYKKGTDAATLLKGRVEEELTSTAAETTTEAPSTTASSSQEGIMEQKHKQALELYVESKLADIVGDKKEDGKGDTKEEETTSKKKNLTKDELYKELAQSSESMVGRTAAEDAKDGDVGTGGAMLVAGTGLAEVILPVEERLKAVQATQQASTGPQAARNKNYNHGMPNSQVPVPVGVPARFQVSAADRHRHFPKNNTDTKANNDEAAQPETSTGIDQDRMGFEATRGKATTANASSGDANSGNSGKDNRNRASDDKVYGNFLKHHRENQWRGGR